MGRLWPCSSEPKMRRGVRRGPEGIGRFRPRSLVENRDDSTWTLDCNADRQDAIVVIVEL